MEKDILYILYNFLQKKHWTVEQVLNNSAIYLSMVPREDIMRCATEKQTLTQALSKCEKIVGLGKRLNFCKTLPIKPLYKYMKDEQQLFLIILRILAMEYKKNSKICNFILSLKFARYIPKYI